MLTYYGKDKDIIQNDSVFEILTTNDPDEPNYSGSYVILEHEGKYGLVSPRTGNESGYNVIEKPVYQKISFLKVMSDPKERAYRFYYLLYTDTGKITILHSEYWKSPNIFDSIRRHREFEHILLFRRGKQKGYLDTKGMDTRLKLGEIQWMKQETKVKWNSLYPVYGDFAFANEANKYALFDSKLNQMTDFVLAHPPYEDRKGRYKVEFNINKEFTILNKNEFFRKYGK